MFWLFAMATTAGVILGTPVLFQALDGPPGAPQTGGAEVDARTVDGPRPSLASFGAATLTLGGLGGLLALAFHPTDLIALVVAVCLGLAGGAMHPELLASLDKD